jgi:hypothetical protein
MLILSIKIVPFLFLAFAKNRKNRCTTSSTRLLKNTVILSSSYTVKSCAFMIQEDETTELLTQQHKIEFDTSERSTSQVFKTHRDTLLLSKVLKSKNSLQWADVRKRLRSVSVLE